MKYIYPIMIIGLLILVGGIFYYINQGAWPLPIVAMAHLFIFGAGLYSVKQIMAAYQRTKNIVFKYFYWSIILPVWCAFLMAFSAFYLFNQPKLFGFIGWNLGMIPHMVGFALLILVTFHLAGRPKLGKIAFWAFVAVSEGVMLLSLINMPEPAIAERGITVWHISQLQGNLIAMALVGVFVPISLYFFIRGIKSSDRVVRVRSLLIGGGILLNTLGEGFLGFGNTVYINGPAAIAVGIAYLLLMAGVTYKYSVGYAKGQLLSPSVG